MKQKSLRGVEKWRRHVAIKKNKFCLEIYTVRWVDFPMITQPLFPDVRKKKRIATCVNRSFSLFLSPLSSSPHMGVDCFIYQYCPWRKTVLKWFILNAVQLRLISFRSRSYTQCLAKQFCLLNLHCYKTMAFQWCNSSNQGETYWKYFLDRSILILEVSSLSKTWPLNLVWRNV